MLYVDKSSAVAALLGLVVSAASQNTGRLSNLFYASDACLHVQ